MLKVLCFENELMYSNCFVVYDEAIGHCIVIDPGSRDSLREIGFIKSHSLELDYIILTHEHSDHTWGVNSLLDALGGQVIAIEECAKELPKAGDMYFRFYFDDPTYHYEVRQVDIRIKDSERQNWHGYQMRFMKTPGHSVGSICFSIENFLFTGDTLMKGVEPVIIKRHGGSKEDYKKSVQFIFKEYSLDTQVFPGHGDCFILGDVKDEYKKFIQ